MKDNFSCFLRPGSVILDSRSEIFSNSSAAITRNNLEISLRKLNTTDGFPFETLSVKVIETSKVPEKLKGYEIALIVIGTIVGFCFILTIGFLVVKYVREDVSNENNETKNNYRTNNFYENYM